MVNIQDCLEKLNHRLIRGETIPQDERREAAEFFLSSVAEYKGRSEQAALFFHAPRNEKRFTRNFIGTLPKTAIFADNFFELEILRLLYLWFPEDERVKKLCGATLERLKSACFGSFCSTGECVGASVSALRFYTAAAPELPIIETITEKIIEAYHGLGGGMAASKSALPRFYVFLALTGLDFDCVKTFLSEQEGFIRTMLTRGSLTGPAVQDTYNVTLLYILRNALATLPAYEYLLTRPVYIRENGRCYCDV